MKEPLSTYIFSLYSSLRLGGFIVGGGHRPCLDDKLIGTDGVVLMYISIGPQTHSVAA
jgi:hypothetical protein